MHVIRHVGMCPFVYLCMYKCIAASRPRRRHPVEQPGQAEQHGNDTDPSAGEPADPGDEPPF